MKEIEILHLYLACKCQTDDGRTGWFSGLDICEKDYSIIMITVRFSNDEEDWAVLNDNEECDRIKLILRPLSSMTEEEKRKLFKTMFPSNTSTTETGAENFIDWLLNNEGSQPSDFVEQLMGLLSIKHFSACTNYLRKNSFDVDGLLESGRAVDASKI